MKIQEGSEDITRGRIMFLCPKTSYMKANTQEDKKNKHLGTGQHSHAPPA